MADRGSIEAGKGHVSLSVDKGPLEKGLAEVQSRLQTFGTGVATLGAGVAAIGGAMIAPFLASISSFTDEAGRLRDASRQTGIGVEELGRLAAGTGGDMETLTTGVNHLGVFLQHAANGGTEANNALSQLGLSFQELNGMSQEQRFLAIANGLNEIADAGQRMAFSREIFGRGGGALNISGGAAGITQRGGRADELGTIMSAEDVQLAKEYGKAWKEVQAVIAATWRVFGAVAVPALMEIYKTVLPIFVEIKRLVDANRPLLEMWFRIGLVVAWVGGMIASVGGVILAIGTALGFVPVIMAKVAAVSAVLLSPIALKIMAIALAVGAVVAIVYGLIYLFPELGDAISSVMGSIGTYFSEFASVFSYIGQLFSDTWGGIVDAISGGELRLAMQIGAAGLEVAWISSINALRDSWFAFRFAFQATFPGLAGFLRGFLVGFMNAFMNMTAFIVNAFVGMINRLMDSLPDWITDEVGIGRLNEHVVDRAAIERMADIVLPAGGAEQAGNEFQDERERAGREGAGARAELERLRLDAWIAAEQRRMQGGLEAALPAGGFVGAGGQSAMGTFSADALRGFTGGEDTGTAIERNTRGALDRLTELIALFNRQNGFVFE